MESDVCQAAAARRASGGSGISDAVDMASASMPGFHENVTVHARTTQHSWMQVVLGADT